MPLGYALENEILRKTKKIEQHIYNNEIWIGNNGGSAEEDNLTPFQLTSGNNAFGAAVQILDIGDTPFRTGNVFFNFSRITIAALDQTTPYYIRIIYGAGTVAAAETAKQYSTISILKIAATTNSGGSPVLLKFKRNSIGTKIWMKTKNVTNAATIDILAGLHEYSE